jgi:hypothetical protein
VLPPSGVFYDAVQRRAEHAARRGRAAERGRRGCHWRVRERPLRAGRRRRRGHWRQRDLREEGRGAEQNGNAEEVTGLRVRVGWKEEERKEEG